MLRGNDIPLRERVLQSPGHMGLSHLTLTGRPTKYKTWKQQHFSRAVEAVKEGKLTVQRAALEFNIPRSTLHDPVSGRVVVGGQCGQEKYLADEEEDELEAFLVGCASIGFAKSRSQVIEIVQQVMSRKGRHVPVTHGWWESFLNLSLRTASPLSYVRMVGSNPEIIFRYFDLLDQTLVDNELEKKPSQIFNLDETGMPLDPNPPRAIAGRGSKHPSAPSFGDRSQITVLVCCSAAGYSLPPFVIFNRLTLRPEYTVGEVPGTIYGLSKKGWIDGELFDLWFTRHFLTHAPPVRPILLLMNGHSSHYHPAVIMRAAEEGIILFTLPPHTSHLTQPLDKGVFGSLKQHWRQKCWNYVTSHPGMVVTRYQFSALFRSAWEKAMTMPNIVAGFRTTGVFPPDCDAVAVLKGLV